MSWKVDDLTNTVGHTKSTLVSNLKSALGKKLIIIKMYNLYYLKTHHLYWKKQEQINNKVWNAFVIKNYAHVFMDPSNIFFN